MPTLKSRLGNPTTTAAAISSEVDSLDILQTNTASAIPVKGDTEGWIDCRSASILAAQIKAVGAAVTVSAEHRVTAAADAVPLELDVTAVPAGESRIVVTSVAVAGQVRFLADGTAGAGNTVNLHVLLK